MNFKINPRYSLDHVDNLFHRITPSISAIKGTEFTSIAKVIERREVSIGQIGNVNDNPARKCRPGWDNHNRKCSYGSVDRAQSPAPI